MKSKIVFVCWVLVYSIAFGAIVFLAKKYADEHGYFPVVAGMGCLFLIGLATLVFSLVRYDYWRRLASKAILSVTIIASVALVWLEAIEVEKLPFSGHPALLIIPGAVLVFQSYLLSRAFQDECTRCGSWLVIKRRSRHASHIDDEFKNEVDPTTTLSCGGCGYIQEIPFSL